jgi:deazaflavin-dependent oxidoreductase (nitroreductase family)
MPDEAMTSERELNERNIEEFRRNGGKVGGPFEGFPLFYIVGSAAGRDGNPGWVFNVRATPNVTVEIGSDPQKTVVAHELPHDERDRIYAIIVQRAPGFGKYEERTDRVIPVFELTPDG